MNKRYRKKIDEPAMSDRTLLLTVEDLIHTAFGSERGNRVHFKLLKTVLHILARELRLLEQDIEIKFDDILELKGRKKAGYDDSYDDESGTYSSSSVEGKKHEGGAEHGRKKDETRETKDRAGKKEKEDIKDRGKKGYKTEQGEKGEKVEKGEKEERKGRREKGEKEDGRTSSKDREDKGPSKDRDKRSRDRNKLSRGKRGEDEWGGERRGDGPGERDGERGVDGRGGRGGEREDRDAQRQDRAGLGRRDFGRQTSSSSITVSETTRRISGGRGSADKILVAERGPTTRVRPARIGSIEVVTTSQFTLLRKAVKQLEQITGPQPGLPEDETLRQDLAKGRASLQDTMQAVQLNERVQAAEQGLYRMAELLTQLAQSGMLPPELAGHVGAMEKYLQAAKAAGSDGPGGPDGRDERRHKRKELDSSEGYDPDSIEMMSYSTTASPMDTKKSKATLAAEAADALDKAGVTHSELYEVMKQMKEALCIEINNLTARANHSAEIAYTTSRMAAEKLDIAMQMNERINSLFEMTAEYNMQLSGFDSGIMTQVLQFQEQLVKMRNDLAAGFTMMDSSNNNAETAALLDLTERHQGLVVDLENTLLLHQNLHITQLQISDEIKNLIKCVEMLHDEKADRDEVVEGLKEKANISCMAGLLREKDFTNACLDIEQRLSKCVNKFSSKDLKWQAQLKALITIANNKGENLMLMSLKDATNVDLNAIHMALCKLEIMLGPPKAAILMRKLAKDASCGACLVRALMEPEDATHGKPLPLPALRPPPLGAEQQTSFGKVKLAPPDMRDHICHRWVGGSHTLIAGNIVKEQPKNMQVLSNSTKKFEDYGSDGRLYMMEEDMQPCAECYKLSTDEPGGVPPHPSTPTGAGDQASASPA